MAGRYIENSEKFPPARPSFLRNFKHAVRPQIYFVGFLSGATSPDKTLPADRSIYGQGRRREGRTRGGKGENEGMGGTIWVIEGAPPPGESRGPHFITQAPMTVLNLGRTWSSSRFSLAPFHLAPKVLRKHTRAFLEGVYRTACTIRPSTRTCIGSSAELAKTEEQPRETIFASIFIPREKIQ